MMKTLPKYNKDGRTNTSKMKTLDCAVDWDVSKIKSADGNVVIEGYANTVDKDRVGDVVIPEAFEKTLPGYLENPVLLFQHDWDKVIGTVAEAKITDKGLWIKARLSAAGDVADVRTKIMEGALKTFSIGYNEVDAVYNESTKTNLVKEIELLEISVVTIPCNAQAKFTVVGTEKTEAAAGEKGLLDPDFFAFAGEAISELGDAEEITAEFLKELYDAYRTTDDHKSFKPKNVKGWTMDEVKYHAEAMVNCGGLIGAAMQKLTAAVAGFQESPSCDTIKPVGTAMWDVEKNIFEAQNHAYAVEDAKYQGVQLQPAAPAKEEADQTTDESGKSAVSGKIKSLTDNEVDHLSRTQDSAWKMATSAMKDMVAAHNAAAKDPSDSTMKAWNDANAAYGRAMAEVQRAMQALAEAQKAKPDATSDGGKQPPEADGKKPSDKPKGE
jgi:HK97 family phage prohead protease